jgi:cytochrome c-type biogenesis protein CcmH
MNGLMPWLLLLSALALAFVIVPLWRHRESAARTALEQRRAKNREVFRQREGELAADLQQGLVNAEEHAKLLAELQRAFMVDMQALDQQEDSAAGFTGRAALLGLALLVPLGGFVLYRSLGSAPDLALPHLLDDIGAAETQEEQLVLLNDLAAFLQQRLERRPDDIRNGFLLGTLFVELDRFDEAVTVLEGLLVGLEPGPDRATVLGNLAQAQYFADDSTVTPRVQATIDEALSLNRNEFLALNLLAIDAFVREDYAATLGYWRRQLSAVTPGSAQAEQLRERIALLESYLPEEAVAAATGQTMTVTIDLAPELRERVSAGMRLFVFVRNPEIPMPILANNLDVPEFPITLTLDNSLSMTGMTLESAPQLVVGARLSRTATAQSGDLQTLSQPFVLSEQTQPVSLVIDTIVP